MTRGQKIKLLRIEERCSNRVLNQIDAQWLMEHYENVIDYNLKEGWELEEAATMVVKELLPPSEC